MADNITVAGTPVATDELDTLNGAAQATPKPHTQRVKLLAGVDGDGTDVSAANPLPVTDAAAETSAAAVAAATGAQADAATANSIIGRLKAIANSLATTASSWLAVRLTDGSSYLQTTSGRLQVADGGVALKTDGSNVTQPVSVGTLPLPAGAATGTKQDLAQTVLDSILTSVAGTLATKDAGTFGYAAGTAAATVDVPVGARVKRVSVLAAGSPATITIAGGATITVPAGGGFDERIPGDAAAGGDVVIGGGVSSYYVAWVI